MYIGNCYASYDKHPVIISPLTKHGSKIYNSLREFSEDYSKECEFYVISYQAFLYFGKLEIILNTKIDKTLARMGDEITKEELEADNIDSWEYIKENNRIINLRSQIK